MQVTCPACQTTLQSQADLTGKSVKCKCGKTFTVGKPAAAAAPAGKISVTCSCGKTLQAPAAAAGKAVKCPCGQLIKVPGGAAQPVAAAAAPTRTAPQARPATAARATAARPAPAQRPAPVAAGGLDPFGSMSDDEWRGLVAKHSPRKPTEEDAKPKEKTAAQKMLDEARKDTNQGKSLVREGAEGYLDQSRWLLVGMGICLLAFSAYQLFMINGFLESAAAAAQAAGDEYDADEARSVIMGLGISAVVVSCTFMVLGFLIFLLPFTCSFLALLLYVLLQIVSLAMNPFELFNLRGWIVRAAIFGALVQAINNAAYYRYVKKQEKEERKKRMSGG